MRHVLRPLYLVILSVFLTPLSAMAQNFPDWSAYPDQVLYAISGFYNATKFFELIADGSSGLYWLTLTAALVGACMILFNSKNLKFGTFGPWLFLVIILLLAPIKSTLLFYPLTEKADPLNITQDQQFYGFLPQVATMHVFTVVHRVIDKALFDCDAVGNCRVRNLIDDSIGAGVLGQDPKVQIPKDGLAEEMYKAYYKMCNGNPRYLAYRKDYNPKLNPYFSQLSTKMFTLGDILEYTKYTYIDNPPGSGYQGSGSSFTNDGDSIQAEFFGKHVPAKPYGQGLSYPAYTVIPSYNTPPFAVFEDKVVMVNRLQSLGLSVDEIEQKKLDHDLGALALANILGSTTANISTAISKINSEITKSNGKNENGSQLSFFMAQNTPGPTGDLDRKIDNRSTGRSKSAENFQKEFANVRGGGRFYDFSDETIQKQVYAFPVQLGGITYLSPTAGSKYDEVLSTCEDLHNSARNIILTKILLSMGMTQADVLNYLTVDPARTSLPTYSVGQPGTTLYKLSDYEKAILSNIPNTGGAPTAEHMAHQQVLADVFQAAITKNENINNLVFINPATGSPVSQSFDKTPEIFSPVSGVVGGVAKALGNAMTQVSAIFKGANAAAYLLFLYHMMNMATVTVILITPLLFIMGVLIPSYAPGVLILSVLAIAVVKIVPITFTIISAILSIISLTLPDGLDQGILIHAAAGLYTGLVGITMFLMFKIGDPGSSLGALQQMDKSSKEIADASVKMTAAIGALTVAAPLGAGAAGAIKGFSKLRADGKSVGQSLKGAGLAFTQEAKEVFTHGLGRGSSMLPFVGTVVEEISTSASQGQAKAQIAAELHEKGMSYADARKTHDENNVLQNELGKVSNGFYESNVRDRVTNMQEDQRMFFEGSSGRASGIREISAENGAPNYAAAALDNTRQYASSLNAKELIVQNVTFADYQKQSTLTAGDTIAGVKSKAGVIDAALAERDIQTMTSSQKTALLEDMFTSGTANRADYNSAIDKAIEQESKYLATSKFNSAEYQNKLQQLVSDGIDEVSATSNINLQIDAEVAKETSSDTFKNKIKQGVTSDLLEGALRKQYGNQQLSLGGKTLLLNRQLAATEYNAMKNLGQINANSSYADAINPIKKSRQGMGLNQSTFNKAANWGVDTSSTWKDAAKNSLYNYNSHLRANAEVQGALEGYAQQQAKGANLRSLTDVQKAAITTAYTQRLSTTADASKSVKEIESEVIKRIQEQKGGAAKAYGIGGAFSRSHSKSYSIKNKDGATTRHPMQLGKFYTETAETITKAYAKAIKSDAIKFDSVDELFKRVSQTTDRAMRAAELNDKVHNVNTAGNKVRMEFDSSTMKSLDSSVDLTKYMETKEGKVIIAEIGKHLIRDSDA